MKMSDAEIGMTLHVILTCARRITNVQVNMDWQHLIMNGESLWRDRQCSPREGCSGTSSELRQGSSTTTT